jgi:hypothetical protein
MRLILDWSATFVSTTLLLRFAGFGSPGDMDATLLQLSFRLLTIDDVMKMCNHAEMDDTGHHTPGFI